MITKRLGGGFVNDSKDRATAASAQDSLSAAVDLIRRRYGEAALIRAADLPTDDPFIAPPDATGDPRP
jgi:hypothetical protein